MLEQAAKPVQIDALTSVRFFLAFWVLIFHQTFGTLVGVLPHSSLWAFNILKTGYLAVGVFFVLSGFVMAHNYNLNDTWSGHQVKKFFIARLARIYPAYLLSLILTAPLILFDIVRGRVSWLEEVQNGLLCGTFLQAWFPYSATSWNYPAWSLSNEIFFYGCLPFIGVLIWRGSARTVASRAILLWIAGLAVPIYAVILPLRGFGDISAVNEPNSIFWSHLIKFSPIFHLFEFLMGVATAKIYQFLLMRRSVLINRGFLLYGPATGAILLTLRQAHRIPYPILHNGLLIPVYAILVLGLALGDAWLIQVFSFAPLVTLGQASYALYVLQFPVERWFQAFYKFGLHLVPVGIFAFALYCILAVICSVLVFHYVEEPANRFCRNVLMRLTCMPFFQRTVTLATVRNNYS